ncbi:MULTISPECIES: tRNA (guanosine(46)-N7)-methyltransferase TrmB [unclassified Oleiphilus]|uniref:tRNA (guanosine(46)-N7)-methyltransferase TrmB n=5 Tax=Oleiphilus TaxID=141450 RepID=UPI0009EF5A00|nr:MULTISPECIES: tRNA (guanosine(46)-N7)-methyltransferase TrmB [unclassified Oleiphilus]
MTEEHQDSAQTDETDSKETNTKGPKIEVANLKKRPIRSFVVRSGRMTAGQQRGFEECWSTMGLELAKAPSDVRESFPLAQPLVVEIGFGMGASLSEMAHQAPNENYLGIEVHRPGVGALLNQAGDLGLENLRVFCADANEVLARNIADDSVSRLQLFFPDPWHKARHNKRRLVQSEFAERIRSKLEIGGVFHMATDWEPYAEHMMEVMEAAPGYENVAGAGQYSERPENRPLTKFEKRGQRLGHGVWDLLYRRIA